MKRHLLFPVFLLLVATGCANLKPDAASQKSEALRTTSFQLSDEEAAWLDLLGETTGCALEPFLTLHS